MSPIHLDHERCSAAVRSKDVRFDGWFVTGVLSTGIYCRPSCPAITPKVRNMRFYPSAAAAQGDGFRACKRCLPNATPGSPEWHVRGDLVARAVRLVADGVVDREGVGGLAARLGYSTRQVERLVAAELGAGPLALARAQRAQSARVLVESTDLTMAQVAHAAGFASIRSFNDTVRQVYAATPTELRAVARRRGKRQDVTRAARDGAKGAPDGAHAPGDLALVGGDLAGATAPTTLTLRLPFRGALHVPSLFGHLIATAVPGVEAWQAGELHRALRLPGGPGLAIVRPPGEGERHVGVTLRLQDVGDLAAAIERCRRMLDLDADPDAVDEHLATDPSLAPLVAAAPGVRLPGSPDPAEMALRAVLGQQISTARAAGLAASLVQELGEPLPDGFGTDAHLFPTPDAIAGADEDRLPGMPGSRRRALRALAEALAAGDLVLGAGADRDQAREQLLALPGIGPWTAEIVLLRGMGDPDAFPASDLGVRQSAAAAGLPGTAAALTAHAARWRPWRGYATALLWASDSHEAARLPHTSAPGTPEAAPSPHTSVPGTPEAAPSPHTSAPTDRAPAGPVPPRSTP